MLGSLSRIDADSRAYLLGDGDDGEVHEIMIMTMDRFIIYVGQGYAMLFGAMGEGRKEKTILSTVISHLKPCHYNPRFMPLRRLR